MGYVIRVLGLAGEPFQSPLRYWLASADVNARGGRGSMVTTLVRSEALTFPSQREAFEFWRQRSTRRPLRPDGRPNRPLTAFTIEIEEH